MEMAPRTRVATRRGKKNPRAKQGGKRGFIAALRAVSADGFPPPSYLNGNGRTRVFGWYKHVEVEDKEARWAVSSKGWTDSKIGYDRLRLTSVYDPVSKARCPGETRLLVLDGRVSPINYKFSAIAFLRTQHTSCSLRPTDPSL